VSEIRREGLHQERLELRLHRCEGLHQERLELRLHRREGLHQEGLRLDHQEGLHQSVTRPWPSGEPSNRCH
jgi:hypothetical protein